MIGTLLGILLTLLVAGFVVYALRRLVALVPMGEPFATGVDLIILGIVLIVVIWMIVTLLGLAGVGVHWPRGL